MSKAEDLLNSLTETVPIHTHPVPDTDTYFVIDPYTREIENTNYNKTVLMRGDHNSERFTFELPRYVDGHDMSLCNRVLIHFDNVGDSIENIHSDVAEAKDLRLEEGDSEKVICSWLIRREATQIVGILSFSLQYLCVEDGEITYEWNTDSYDNIEIRKSKQNAEASIVKYTNVLEEWRAQIFGVGDSIISNITTEGETQVAAVKEASVTEQEAIELKGSEVLESIPNDFADVYSMANEALRTKADGVVCEVEGTMINILDSSDDYIRGLNLYGKTTPDGVSIENPTVTFTGDNVDAQTITFNYILAGTTVESDGNYTDSDGQQWTSDEIDCERGVYIQRVNTPDGTPIETPLTDDEIEAYKTIKTNYPNTTILNDAAAMMKVKYNADTKLYINKTVEIGVSDAVEDVLNDTY